MKTFFKLLVLLGGVAYLFYVFADISGKRDSTRCKEVNVIIVDSSYAGFINADEVVRILKKEKIYPVGQLMEEVNGDSLEKALEKNSFVSIVKCYKTPGGRVNINISQRLPILRIKADNGDDYYIDNKGVAMMPENYTADVAVATGRISKRYAAKNLVHLARYLHTNDFANDLVEQINVAHPAYRLPSDPNGKARLADPEDADAKLARVLRQGAADCWVEHLPRNQFGIQQPDCLQEKLMPEAPLRRTGGRSAGKRPQRKAVSAS